MGSPDHVPRNLRRMAKKLGVTPTEVGRLLPPKPQTREAQKRIARGVQRIVAGLPPEPRRD